MKSPCKTAWQRKWLELDATSSDVQAMANAVENFAGAWFKNKPRPSMLVLSGPSGVGKSYAAKHLHRFAEKAAFSSFEDGAWTGPLRVPSSLFLRWPETCDAFKDGEYGVVRDAFEADLLILDDIGAEHDPSKNAADKLCQILSRRENKFTVVTTNIAPQSWESKFDRRIADRLLRNSLVVELAGTPSYALV